MIVNQSFSWTDNRFAESSTILRIPCINLLSFTTISKLKIILKAKLFYLYFGKIQCRKYLCIIFFLFANWKTIHLMRITIWEIPFHRFQRFKETLHKAQRYSVIRPGSLDTFLENSNFHWKTLIWELITEFSLQCLVL